MNKIYITNFVFIYIYNKLLHQNGPYLNPITFNQKKKNLKPKDLSSGIYKIKEQKKKKKKEGCRFKGERSKEMKVCRHQSHHQSPPLENCSPSVTPKC